MEQPDVLNPHWAEDPQFRKILQRYVEIQKQERQLGQEKKELQQQVADYMKRENNSRIYLDFDNRKLRITHTERVDIAYNESILQTRLGPAYENILDLDLKKVKLQSQQLRSHLGEHWLLFASPDRNKIKAQIEAGTLNAAQFHGTFEKKVKSIVAVSTLRDAESPPDTSNGPF